MRKRKRKRNKRTPPPAWAGAVNAPIITIAQYGPNDKTVTKVVAALAPQAGVPTTELRRWVGTKITDDPKFRNELLEFIQSHGARKLVLTTGVIGCIHEEGEGKDYPSGEECPYCPFWRGRDRWANAEPIVMTLNDLRSAEEWPG